jgi:hypothetical protein
MPLRPSRWNDATKNNEVSWKPSILVVLVVSVLALTSGMFYHWHEVLLAPTRILSTLREILQSPTPVNGTSLRKGSRPFLEPVAKDASDGTTVPHKTPTSPREQTTGHRPEINSQPQPENLSHNKPAVNMNLQIKEGMHNIDKKLHNRPGRIERSALAFQKRSMERV